MSDTFLLGQRFRILNIIDDFNREVLWLEIDTSLSATQMLRFCNRLLKGAVILNGSTPLVTTKNARITTSSV